MASGLPRQARQGCRLRQGSTTPLWFCIETVDRQMREAVENGDVDTTLRCSNALNLLGGTYFRMVQGDAQEARIKELERIVQQGRAAKVSASEYFGWKVNGDAK